MFAALLKEGDLLRRLTKFSPAEQVYRELVNKFPHHGDVIYARLRLAETHNAQGGKSDAHRAAAEAQFEQLLAGVEAPVDVRVEAGYNLGLLLARKGDTKKAIAVWWGDVVQPFLLDETANKGQLGATGRQWMTRTLIDVGDLFEKQEKLEEAQRAWQLILETKLPNDSLARARLRRFGAPEAKP